MNLSAVEAVLFDLDDTLIDWSQSYASWDEMSAPHMMAVYEQVMACAGAPELHFEDFLYQINASCQIAWNIAIRDDFRMPSYASALYESIAALGVSLSEAELKRTLDTFDWRAPEEVIPFGDTLALLTWLRERGYRVGVVTNSFLPATMRWRELEHLKLAPLIDTLITSGDYGRMKPHPAIFHHALDEMGVMAEEAIFVGDSLGADIRGAQRAGIFSVLHISRRDLHHRVYGVEPDHTIQRLRELPALLEGRPSPTRRREHPTPQQRG